MTEYKLSGPWATRDLWVAPEWQGMPRFGPHLLPDGRDILDLIERGDIEELGFDVWFRQVEGSRGQRFGDLLWAGGLATKVVSRRFVDALEDLGVAGHVRTYPVRMFDRKMRPIEKDYVGLVEPTGGDGEIHAAHPTLRNTGLVVSARVFEGLQERGVTDYRAEPYVPFELPT
jgi:hypothetical protein